MATRDGKQAEKSALQVFMESYEAPKRPTYAERQTAEKREAERRVREAKLNVKKARKPIVESGVTAFQEAMAKLTRLEEENRLLKREQFRPIMLMPSPVVYNHTNQTNEAQKAFEERYIEPEPIVEDTPHGRKIVLS